MRIGVDTMSSTKPRGAAIGRCLRCRAPLGGRADCSGCGRSHPVVGGIWEAIGPLDGANRVASAFYSGPGWRRFRKWEHLFLCVQGGPRWARRQVLRHLPERPSCRVLEVGIGDGANLSYLPVGWEIFGADIARPRLSACLARHGRSAGRLSHAEAEALPYDDDSFDAVFTVGGFNHFGDPGAALREMRRVARPGAPLVAADEVPDLPKYGLGHLIGVPSLDRRWMRALGLDPDFADLVLSTPLDVDAVASAEWPHHRRHRIWGGLGYCLVDHKA